MPEQRLSVQLLPTLASTSAAAPLLGLSPLPKAHHELAEQFQSKAQVLASPMKSQRT